MTTRTLGNRRDDWLGPVFGLVVMVPAACSFLAGAAILLWQTVQWLVLAQWPTLTVIDEMSWWCGHRVAMEHFMGPYLGLNEALGWILQIPLAAWLMLFQPLAWMIVWVVILEGVMSLFEALSSPG